MRFVALIAAIALLPVVGAGGYVVGSGVGAGSAPTLREAVTSHLRAVPGGVSEDWLFVPTRGRWKGHPSEAVASLPYTPKQYRQYGVAHHIWVVRTCRLYSTSGNAKAPFDRDGVVLCKERRVTRKAVVRHARELRPNVGAIGHLVAPA